MVRRRATLAGETLALSPCTSLAVALHGYRTHFRARRPYRRSITRKGTFGAPLHPIDPFGKTMGYRALGTTHRTWRCASPPAPNHGSKGVSPPLETHSQGDFALPCTPSTWAAFLPPRPLTISWRRLHRDQGREHFIAALPWSLPIDQRACHTPWNPDQPFADWMPSAYRR